MPISRTIYYCWVYYIQIYHFPNSVHCYSRHNNVYSLSLVIFVLVYAFTFFCKRLITFSSVWIETTDKTNGECHWWDRICSHFAYTWYHHYYSYSWMHGTVVSYILISCAVMGVTVSLSILCPVTEKPLGHSPAINHAPDGTSWKQSRPCLKRPFDSALYKYVLFDYGYGLDLGWKLQVDALTYDNENHSCFHWIWPSQHMSLLRTILEHDDLSSDLDINCILKPSFCDLSSRLICHGLLGIRSLNSIIVTPVHPSKLYSAVKYLHIIDLACSLLLEGLSRVVSQA